MNPHIIKVIAKADKERIKREDYINWISGQYYVFRQLVTAIDNVYKGKAEYIEKPILWKIIEDSELTEEEREKRDMLAEIRAMDKWIENDRKLGLPETSM